LEIAVKNSVWGSKKRISTWSIGEKIVFLVEDDGVVFGKVSGEQFFSEDGLWEDDLYPWRVPINFESQLSGKEGRDFQIKLRLALKASYGKSTGALILFRLKLPDHVEGKVEELIQKECK